MPFRSASAALGWDLDLEVPVRRCPSCGFSDDAEVVVCVRCGYDWRAGARLEDAHEASDRSARRRAVSDAADTLGVLERLAPLLWTPLAVALGPFVLVRTAGARGPRSGRTDAERQRVQRLRVLAAVGGGVWLLALGVGVAAVRGASRGGEGAAALCRARLGRVQRAIAEVRGRAGTFPADRSVRFPAAVRALTQGALPLLQPEDLVCPLGDGLYPYELRAGAVLDAEAAPDCVLVWDRATHGQAGEPVRVHALRIDGAVEVLIGRGALDDALRRPARRAQAAAPRADDAEGPPPAEVPDDWAHLVARFGALADELEALGPSASMTVSEEAFAERVGEAPTSFLTRAVREGDAGLQRRVAAMLARCELSRERRRALTAALRSSDDLELAWTALLAERRWDDPGWRGRALALAQAGSPEVQARARELLAREAAGGADAVEALLAAGVAAGGGALAGLALPPEALTHVARRLGQGRLGAAAEEVLVGSGPDGARATREALAAGPPAARLAGFRVLVALMREGALEAGSLLELAAAEAAPSVQAAVVADLAGEEPIAAEVVDWVLELLRRGAPEEVRAPCARLLARVGQGRGPEAAAALERLVLDLARPGDPAAVIEELAAPARRVDARIDAVLAARWDELQLGARRALPRALARRLQPEAARVLARALGDSDAEVVVAAAEALEKVQAPLDDDARAAVARGLAAAIEAGRSGAVSRALLDLARRPRLCAVLDDDPAHTCTPELRAALAAAARSGERDAVRALAAHRNLEALEVLADLVEHRAPAVRDAAGDALVAVTGIRRYYRTGAQVRAALEPHTEDLARRLRVHGERERAAIRSDLARAERRLQAALGQ